MAASAVTVSLILTIISIQTCAVSTAKLTGNPPLKINYVEYGKTIAVTCSPESSASAIDLKWYGPYEYRPGSSEPKHITSRTEMPREENGAYSRIYTQPSGYNLKLFVTSLKDIDTGVYNCTGRVDNIPSYWSFELQAYVGLTVTADAEQILIHGENTKIGCSVQSQPSPETDWYFNAQYINPIENPKYEVATDGLIVYDVEYADAGQYECIGTEVTYGTTIPAYISVDVVSRPVMSQPPVNTTGTAYRDAPIQCSASSTPPPTYKWYLGTKDSSSGTDVDTLGDRFRASHAQGDLTIVNVQLEDEHWYWCEASNRAGKVYGKLYFEVQVFPVFSDSVNLNKTETHEGDVVEMICQSEAKPNAKMSFQREGYPDRYINGFQPNDQRVYVYEKPSSAQVENQLIIPQEVVIKISDTTPNDTANYTCIAENSAGRNQTNMHIIIQHQPNYELMTTELSTQCIWEENPRNITALLSGFPQPAVAWARGDGRQISPDEEAFKIFFEPYWENGRRDEWMANLQINWRVTKEGIQGAYEPTGNYFPTATNNLGTVSYTINVVKAEFPGRVSSINITEQTPRTIKLAAEPPVEDNCIPTQAFQVLYSRHGTNDYQETLLFTLDERSEMVLDDLEAAVSYTVLVYAVNERGRSATPNSIIVSTRESTAPDVVEITSEEKALSTVSHLVVWLEPEDGGERITDYVISWRETGKTEWNTRDVSTGSVYWSIPDLESGTHYELTVQARNRKGLSRPQSPVETFYTPGDPSTAGSSGSLPLELHFIIIIAVVALLIILVAVDMICFCSMNCGVLACICGGVGTEPKQNDFLSLDMDYNNSQPSLGGDMSLAPGTDKVPSADHEYINTARIQPTRPLASQRPAAGSQPVPQPRVPTQYYVGSNTNQRYNSSQNPYQPTATSRTFHQSGNADHETDIDYPDRLRSVPRPSNRSNATMI